MAGSCFKKLCRIAGETCVRYRLINDGDRITGISKVAAAEKTQENAQTQAGETAPEVSESVVQPENTPAEEQTPEQE